MERNLLNKKSQMLDNKFWYDIFQAWVIFVNKIQITSWVDIPHQPLWHSENVNVGGKIIFYLKNGLKND